MKKICLSLLIFLLIFTLGACSVQSTANTKPEYLRIHIRANSNAEIDQTIKYQVKSAVVEYLTPLVSEMKSKSDAINKINDHLNDINQVCDKTLENNGFNYKATAKINNEKFPTRNYGNFTLQSGYYDALIIELGEGIGDNWWCVVYPPLCFTGTGETVYKSKIIDIINKFKGE